MNSFDIIQLYSRTFTRDLYTSFKQTSDVLMFSSAQCSSYGSTSLRTEEVMVFFKKMALVNDRRGYA